MLVLLVCICSVHMYGNSSSVKEVTAFEQKLQSETVTLNFKNRPLKEVLNAIKSQTGVGFAISNEAEKEIGRVTVALTDISVAQALEKIFANTDYQCTTVNNQIVVNRKPAQEGKITISGKVLDNREPVPGAVVFIKGTSTGVEADADGNFKLVMNQAGAIEV